MIGRKTRRGSPLHITPSFELFKKSKKLVTDNLEVFLPLYIVPLIFTIHSWIWTPAPDSHTSVGRWHDYSWLGSGFGASSLPSYFWYVAVGVLVLWVLFVLVAGTLVQIMSQQAQLDASRGKTPIKFERLWATVREMGWRMFGLYLTIGIYVIVGLILFIAPGLIMIRRYFLAPYVMLDRRCGIKEAMDASAEMSKPYSGYVWGVIGVMALIGLINVIPFIGWMIAFTLGMFYSIAPAFRYQELKRLAS